MRFQLPLGILLSLILLESSWLAVFDRRRFTGHFRSPTTAVRALKSLLVGQQEEHPAHRKLE